jgi:hypothetical protein
VRILQQVVSEGLSVKSVGEKASRV